MADKYPAEGSSASEGGSESSESVVELNVKTLDSQIYRFHVDKNMPISLFKEKIANEIGLPVGQQRLIFRGKVLKDNHLLSEYHVDNGHTLHLVARQPSESQLPSNSSIGETSADNGGQDAGATGSRNRVGHISHSVVLGTLNLGDQGEGVVPDLTRVMGAVLNSIGIGGQAITNGMGGVPTVQINAPVQPPPGNDTEGTRNGSGIQSQAAGQTQQGQALPGQSIPQFLRIPMGAAIPVPTFNTPIPDSLRTLSEFMSRIELALSQNGYQPNQFAMNSGDLPTVELPSNVRGLSTLEALSIVMRHAERLLSGHATAALSQIAGRLEREGGSTDPTVRGQIQSESIQVGMAMQHLGSLLLELGRTILTLRMGQSPAESFVNSGPAVYISSLGPNPIMVQPFPLQATSIFGSSPSNSSNPGTIGPVSIGTVPRNVNIHIHTAVSPGAAVVEGAQGDRGNRTGSGDSGPTQLSTNIAAGVNSQLRNHVDAMRSGNSVPSGPSENISIQNANAGSHAVNDEGDTQPINSADSGTRGVTLGSAGAFPEVKDQKAGSECQQSSKHEDAESGLNAKYLPSSSSGGESHDCSIGGTELKAPDDSKCPQSSAQMNDKLGAATAVPLGLGMGGLQPKRRHQQTRSLSKNSESGTSGDPNQSQEMRMDAQEVLLSLASLADRRNSNTPSSGQISPDLDQIMERAQVEAQGANGQFDVANAMSQVLHGPAFSGLLAGVSEQTRVGSPDMLRNMMVQITQSPGMMNTVNQIAQQLEGQDLGSMLGNSGRGTGGGGIDLSSVFRQMMPFVSQALAGGSTIPRSVPAAASQLQHTERRLGGDGIVNNQNHQIDLQQVVESIENQDLPREVFRSMVEVAAHLDDSGRGHLIEELCVEESLAREFMELLRHDISQRLQAEEGSEENS